MTERKTIEVPVAFVGCSELNGKLHDAIAKLVNLQSLYGDDAVIDYGRYLQRSDNFSYKLTVSRQETDAELNERLANADKNKKENLELERKKLKQLASKFNMKLVPKDDSVIH